MKVKVKRIERLISLLSKAYRKRFFRGNPFNVLVATILSQRTKDVITYSVVPKLFKQLRSVKDFAEVPLPKLERMIRKVGFYKQKARRIKQLSKLLISKYGGKVPDSLEELLKLPGVGRKTANCVLLYGFGKAALPVDVHVHRISNRIGLIRTKNPEQSELKLKEIIPRRYWTRLNELLVQHGQRTCLPRRPRCAECLIRGLCDFYKKSLKTTK